MKFNLRYFLFFLATLAAAAAFYGTQHFFSMTRDIVNAKFVIGRSVLIVLDTPVVTPWLQISQADKTASLRGLRVGNPPGFSDADALVVGNVSASFAGDAATAIVVKDAVVDGLQIGYEPGPKESNLDVLQKNLRTGPHADMSSAYPSRIVIRKLRIQHAEIVTKQNSGAPLELPEMTLADIGTDAKPITPAEAAKRILGEVLHAASLAMTPDTSGLMRKRR
jgi:hypothetical protein